MVFDPKKHEEWDRPKPLDSAPRQLDSWRRSSRPSFPSFENFGAEISAPNCQVGDRAFGTIPEESRDKFLKALLDHIQERLETKPDLDWICNGPFESELADRTGLSRHDIDMIGREFCEEEIIGYGNGGGDVGRVCHFTSAGYRLAKEKSYEKTALAQRRKVAVAAKAGGKWLLLKVAGGIALVVAPIAIANRDQLIGWIKARQGL
jgi:hypothetical protein